MSKSRALVCLLFAAVFFSSLSHAVTPDRITGDLNSGQKVQLYSSTAPSRPGQDLGRADGSRVIEGVTLAFQLSPAQQKDMDQFLVQLADRSSPNYHRYLTRAQYAARFGMSQNDVDKVVAWVQAAGFTNIKVANNHNRISFDGSVAQIESALGFEMHNYLVNGVVHLANATNPWLPPALANVVVHIGHLNDFAPKPRLVRSHFTSYVTGSHYLTPGDFATIYDLNPLYSAGATGSTQKIAVVGQSTVNASDLSNFRSAAGLAASTVTMTLIEGTGTRCPGDEGESDLDLEWAGGVAKNAQIIFLYAGLDPNATPPDTCASRFYSVWDAMEEALTGSLSGSGTPVAPFVSTSYGYCEPGLQAQDNGFVAQIRTWVQAGQTQGVTLVSASGDAGAADCDSTTETSATGGIAVDAPASIPETTGAGGNEFSADSTTSTPPGADAPYWAAAGSSSDTISSALEYIPEEAWNDTAQNIRENEGGGLAASGGGASTLFTKPTWQTQTGNSLLSGATMRLVPDISLSASANHDGYLYCSEDTGTDTTVSTCTDGFRTGAGGDLAVVGGTSAVAPTFSAILALLNQYFGAASGVGLAPVNPELYQFAPQVIPYPATATFHDVTTGNNIVPCTTGSTDCPTTSPFQYGFSTGPGYDEVTGLGSVDAYQLALVWGATIPSFSITAGAFNPGTVPAGGSAVTTITVAPNNGFNSTVSFACAGLPSGASCSFSPTTVTGGSGTTQMTVQTVPTMSAATTSITVNGTSSTRLGQGTASLAVTATTESFTLSANVATGGTISVSQGQTSGAVNMTVTNTGTPSFVVSSGTSTQTAVPVTYTCSGLPTESTCLFNGTANTLTTQLTAVALTIQTTAPTAKLERPFDHGTRIFYALLMPGMFGILFTVGSRKRTLRGMRFLALILMIGFATLWTSSCGGSGSGNTNQNPGTPTGSSSITVNATTGTTGLSASLQYTLTVTAAP